MKKLDNKKLHVRKSMAEADASQDPSTSRKRRTTFAEAEPEKPAEEKAETSKQAAAAKFSKLHKKDKSDKPTADKADAANTPATPETPATSATSATPGTPAAPGTPAPAPTTSDTAATPDAVDSTNKQSVLRRLPSIRKSANAPAPDTQATDKPLETAAKPLQTAVSSDTAVKAKTSNASKEKVAEVKEELPTTSKSSQRRIGPGTANKQRTINSLDKSKKDLKLEKKSKKEAEKRRKEREKSKERAGLSTRRSAAAMQASTSGEGSSGHGSDMFAQTHPKAKSWQKKKQKQAEVTIDTPPHAVISPEDQIRLIYIRKVQISHLICLSFALSQMGIFKYIKLDVCALINVNSLPLIFISIGFIVFMVMANLFHVFLFNWLCIFGVLEILCLAVSMENWIWIPLKWGLAGIAITALLDCAIMYWGHYGPVILTARATIISTLSLFFWHITTHMLAKYSGANMMKCAEELTILLFTLVMKLYISTVMYGRSYEPDTDESLMVAVFHTFFFILGIHSQVSICAVIMLGEDRDDC